MKIDVDYTEPAQAGIHKFTVETVEEIESEFGPRICLNGSLEGGDMVKMWLPKPKSMTSDRTKLANIYDAVGLDWRDAKSIDPVEDLIGGTLEVELTYTDENYPRLSLVRTA
jgi:hypothetical protein